MRKKNMGKVMVCIFMVMLMLATGCKASAIDTENTVPDETTAAATVFESAKDTTETAVITIPPMETTEAALTPAETTAAATVKETTATIAPVATTKATAAPVATTKAPAATTAAPPVETAAPPVETAPPAVTTAAPSTDYTAVCADIRSKLIAILEANGKWDPNFAGTVRSWGQKWWGIGWYADGDMTTQEFADEYYNGKFAGGTITACGVDCYVADNKIYLDYQGY